MKKLNKHMLIIEKGNKHAKCKLLVKLNTVYGKRLRKKSAVRGASYYLKLLLSSFFFLIIYLAASNLSCSTWTL